MLIEMPDGVKLNHHDEKDVLLEFNTSKQILQYDHAWMVNRH